MALSSSAVAAVGGTVAAAVVADVGGTVSARVVVVVVVGTATVDGASVGEAVGKGATVVATVGGGGRLFSESLAELEQLASNANDVTRAHVPLNQSRCLMTLTRLKLADEGVGLMATLDEFERRTDHVEGRDRTVVKRTNQQAIVAERVAERRVDRHEM